MKEFLILSTSIDLLRVACETIIYISSDGNYSTIVQADGEARVVTLQLGQIEKLIAAQLKHEADDFIRIGKSLIINKNHIHYIHISKQRLTLSDGVAAKHTLSASREALKQLKELLEQELK